MRSSVLVLGFIVAAAVGCSSKNDQPLITVSLSPTTSTVNAGGPAVTFRATASSGTVQWSLAPAVGTLSSKTGPSTQYTPPATVASTTQVTLSATVTGAQAPATAKITINPVGSLSVNIVASEGTPAVTVTGPNDFHQDLTASQTFTVPVGTYAVSATSVRASEPVVDRIFDPSIDLASPAVTSGATTTATVTYAQRQGTGMLWLPVLSESSNLIGFDPNAVSGVNLQVAMFTADAGVTADGTDASGEAVAFDEQGTLWFATDSSGLFQYPPSALINGAQLVPGIVFSSVDAGVAGVKTLDGAEGITFDSTGNLWVALCASPNAILRYSAAQVALGGAVAPELVLEAADVDAGSGTAPIPSLKCPYDMEFDRAGNLWVSNYSASTVVRYSNPETLIGEVAVQPDVVLVDYQDAGADGVPYETLHGPQGIAFDPTGNLWVANWISNTVTKYGDLSNASGVVAQPPIAVLTDVMIDGGFNPDGGPPPFNVLDTPASVAIDNAGNLWVCAEGNHPNVSKFTNIGALQDHVSPAPAAVVLNMGDEDSCRFNFNPAPKNLPLAQQH